MAIVLDTLPQTAFAGLQVRLIDYAGRVGEFRSPDEVLDELNAITTQSPKVWRLGVCPNRPMRFPA